MAALDVSLRQLEYIVAVADLKGFRRAADACDVAQPSLSMQVALAERQLGVQIFERDHRSVRLSVVGAAIVEQARRVLGAARELRELARQSADPFRGTLRLGVIPTIGPYLLPEITPRLSKTFPHLQLLWTEARTGDLVQELKDGRLDGVLLALEADVSDLDYEVIARDPFVLAASLKPSARQELEAHAGRCAERPGRAAPRRWALFSGAGVELLHAGERRGAQLSRDQPGDARADGERGHRGDAPAVTGIAGRESPRSAARAPIHFA